LTVDLRRTSTVAAGAVALAAGTYQALTGIRGTPGDGRRDDGLDPWLRNVDSELRYYGVWYAAAGARALSTALRTGPASRAAGLPWLLAGAARLRGTATHRPDPAFVALGVVEVSLGGLLLFGRRDLSEREPRP
jgi:hypothetical protein